MYLIFIFMRNQNPNTMKKVVTLSFFIITVFLFSCGPTAEQKAAAEKAKADSIAMATQTAMETKRSLEAEIEGMNNRLMAKRADLDVAKSQMGKIQEFQFLRTESEKEQQVHDQSIKIQTIEQEIAATEQDIAAVTIQLNKVVQTLARK